METTLKLTISLSLITVWCNFLYEFVDSSFSSGCYCSREILLREGHFSYKFRDMVFCKDLIYCVTCVLKVFFFFIYIYTDVENEGIELTYRISRFTMRFWKWTKQKKFKNSAKFTMQHFVDWWWQIIKSVFLSRGTFKKILVCTTRDRSLVSFVCSSFSLTLLTNYSLEWKMHRVLIKTHRES